MYYHQIVIATDLPANYAIMEMSRLTKMQQLAEYIYIAMASEVGELTPAAILMRELRELRELRDKRSSASSLPAALQETFEGEDTGIPSMIDVIKTHNDAVLYNSGYRRDEKEKREGSMKEDIMKTEIKDFTLLRTVPDGHCPECAIKHEPEEPHDAMSLFYKFKFQEDNGRFPTWEDAMSHCSDEIKKLWIKELAGMEYEEER